MKILKKIFNNLKKNFGSYFLYGLLALYFLGIVFGTLYAPGSKIRHYEFEGIGRVVCVETWEAKKANYKKECVWFEPTDSVVDRLLIIEVREAQKRMEKDIRFIKHEWNKTRN